VTLLIFISVLELIFTFVVITFNAERRKKLSRNYIEAALCRQKGL